jgi:hypothetical protein
MKHGFETASRSAADVDDNLAKPGPERSAIAERFHFSHEFESHFLHEVIHFDGLWPVSQNDRRHPSSMGAPKLLLGGAITAAGSRDEPLLRTLRLAH